MRKVFLLAPPDEMTHNRMMKREPNRQIYIDVLRKMTPENRLNKSFELNELAKNLLRHGLRSRFPEATDAELGVRLRRRIDKCHNQNY